METKKQIVKISALSYIKEMFDTSAKEAVKPFEIDGWQANTNTFQSVGMDKDLNHLYEVILERQ